METLTNPKCPHCGSDRVYRDGIRYLSAERKVQRWLCRECGYRFSGVDDKGTRNISSRRQPPSSRICVTETKNLDTTALLIAVGDGTQKGLLLQFAYYLNREAKSEHTIRTYINCLKRLSRNADLDNPDTIKEYLANIKKSENTKAGYCVAYTAFLQWQGKTWKPPKYSARSPIPEWLPTEEEIDQLIAGCGKKTSAILQTLKETGMRIGECVSLPWTTLNDEANVLTLNKPEKHSLPRIFKVSKKLIMMLQSLPKKTDRIFGVTSAKDAQRSFARARRKIAVKVKNPRLAKIHFHLIRHWKGTMEYHKTHDPDHVRRLLGHKSILSTQIYINMEQALFAGNADEYIVRRPKTSQEEDALISVGFEYVRFDSKENTPVYRKRK